VRQLLGAGCCHYTADKRGQTPLHGAVAMGHEEVVNLLLNAGSDHNREDNDGITPIFIAAQKKHTNIMQRMMSICVVCLCAKREIVLGCGHLELCTECCDNIKKSTNRCPHCRANITNALKIFT
jgi:hypothetical protein